MKLPCLRVMLCLVALAPPLRAQDARVAEQRADSNRVVEKGAQLRIWTGTQESTTLIGRLEGADSQSVRIVVSGEEGDPRLKFVLLGVAASGDGTADSVVALVPWRLIRKIEVASGLRSRRVANAIYGSLIGAGVLGGLGAVYGATQANSNCSSGSANTCGISASSMSGMATGAVVGGLAGGIYGVVRRSFVILWTPLPDRGRQLRAWRPPAP